MCVEIQAHFEYCKIIGIYFFCCHSSYLPQRQHPPTSHGLSSSGKMVPRLNPYSGSYTHSRYCTGMNTMAGNGVQVQGASCCLMSEQHISLFNARLSFFVNWTCTPSLPHSMRPKRSRFPQPDVDFAVNSYFPALGRLFYCYAISIFSFCCCFFVEHVRLFVGNLSKMPSCFPV